MNFTGWKSTTFVTSYLSSLGPAPSPFPPSPIEREREREGTDKEITATKITFVLLLVTWFSSIFEVFDGYRCMKKLIKWWLFVTQTKILQPLVHILNFLALIFFLRLTTDKRFSKKRNKLPWKYCPTVAFVLPSATGLGVRFPIWLNGVPFWALLALPLLLAVFPAEVLLYSG